jgi:hypothetical protein
LDEIKNNDINMNDVTMLMIDEDLLSMPGQKMDADMNDDESDIGENELFERKYPNNNPDTPLSSQTPHYYQFDEYKIDSTILTNTLTTPSHFIPSFNDTTFSTGMMSESQQKQLDKLMVVRKKQCLKMRKILNAHSYVKCSALDDESIRKLMEEALFTAVNYHNNKLKLTNINNNNNNSLNINNSIKLNNTTSTNPLLTFGEKIRGFKRAHSMSRSSRKDTEKVNDKIKKIPRKSSLGRCLSCTTGGAVSRSETMTSMESNKKVNND